MSAGSSRLWLVPFIDLIRWRANSNEGASWDGPGRRDSRQDDLTNPAFVSESVVTKTNRYLGVEWNLFFLPLPSPAWGHQADDLGTRTERWSTHGNTWNGWKLSVKAKGWDVAHGPKKKKKNQNKRVMQSDQNFNVGLHNSSLTFRGKWQRRL